MSKFSKPHFYEEGIDVVSIWISKVPENEIPKSYFEENYSGNDEEPFIRRKISEVLSALWNV